MENKFKVGEVVHWNPEGAITSMAWFFPKEHEKATIIVTQLPIEGTYRGGS